MCCQLRLCGCFLIFSDAFSHLIYVIIPGFLLSLEESGNVWNLVLVISRSEYYYYIKKPVNISNSRYCSVCFCPNVVSLLLSFILFVVLFLLSSFMCSLYSFFLLYPAFFPSFYFKSFYSLFPVFLSTSYLIPCLCFFISFNFP